MKIEEIDFLAYFCCMFELNVRCTQTDSSSIEK